MESVDATANATATPSDSTALGPAIVAIKFRNAGRAFDFDASGIELVRGDRVLVEFADTQVVGTVLRTQSLAASSGTAYPKVIRAIGPHDEHKLARIQDIERDAFKFALLKLRQKNLPAKMVAVELSFPEDKMTFYVASEERIDLRGWVRDISQQYRARIDVRQIGARDAAKLIGGIGSCGRELCCSTWLVDFRPVSIKMAKDQNLALNPEKVSGQCGRLLCCLTYEQDTYRDMRRGLPKIGKRVYTPMGDGRVKDVNVLRRRVRVQLLEGYEEFDAEQVSPMFGGNGELLEPNFGPTREHFEDDHEEGDEQTPVSPQAAGTSDEAADAAAIARADRESATDRMPEGRIDPDTLRPQRNTRGSRPEGESGARGNDPRASRQDGDRDPRNDRGPRPERAQYTGRGPRPELHQRRGGKRGPRPGGTPGEEPRLQPDGTPSPCPERAPPRGDKGAPNQARRGDDGGEDHDDGPDAGGNDTAGGAPGALGPRDPNAPRRRRRRRGGRGGRSGRGGQGGGPPSGGGAPPGGA